MRVRGPARLVAAASFLAAAACASSDPAKTAASRDAWYGATMPSNAGGEVTRFAIDLNETSQGLAGRAHMGNEATYVLRNIQRTDTHLSFMVTASDAVTAFDATFSGERSGAGWAGTWANPKETRDLNLQPVSPPDEHGLQMVALPDGRRMHLACLGEGSPTVLFDSGSGGSVKDWRLVHAEIAKTTRACAYDRAGLGLSDPGPAPRDAAAAARDMEATLKAANITGPVVVVGHSIGSFHVRQFANTHAKQVVGMVLVDPSGDFQSDRFAASAPHFAQIANPETQIQSLQDCAARARRELMPHGSPAFTECNGNEATRFETVASEIASMMTLSSPELARSRRSYGDMPLIVLTRGDFAKGMPPEATPEDIKAMQTTWRQTHEEMRALSTVGERRDIAGSGHYVQMDQPQAVIAAVDDVVAAARRRAFRSR
ncbi:MAG: alpha/beta hydrolase [Alphaproteobacteria bacterium]